MFRKKTEQQTIPEEAVPASYAALMRRAMIRSTVFAALAFATAVIATLAWFANNRDVVSNGFQAGIELAPNLMITLDPSDTQSWDVSATLTEEERILLPVMHTDGGDTNLQYVNDSVDIDRNTGLPADADELMYEPVPAEDADNPLHYYIEKTVYIGSKTMAMRAPLTATIEALTDEALPDYYRAVSVDFYVGGEYKDTLNLAGLALSNDEAYDVTAVKTTTVTLANPVPCYDGAHPDYLTVMMRFYFDGALHNSADTTYVTTNSLKTDELGIKLKFSVPEW